jgi:hypothetical protein
MPDDSRKSRDPAAPMSAPEPDSATWTGFIRRCPDGIEGELRDPWGWRLSLHGVRQPDGTYSLTGALGDPPPSLRIPQIDGPPEDAP